MMGKAWLMQLILFLTLGLLVFPSRIMPLIGMGLLISGFLIFVARPLGVFISLAFLKLISGANYFFPGLGFGVVCLLYLPLTLFWRVFPKRS
jgi:cell volume regulation protein A